MVVLEDLMAEKYYLSTDYVWRVTKILLLPCWVSGKGPNRSVETLTQLVNKLFWKSRANIQDGTMLLLYCLPQHPWYLQHWMKDGSVTWVLLNRSTWIRALNLNPNTKLCGLCNVKKTHNTPYTLKEMEFCRGIIACSTIPKGSFY